MIDIALIVLFFLCVQLRDRIYLPVPLLDAEIPALDFPMIIAAVGLAAYRIHFSAQALHSRVVALWAPFMILGIVLPIMGIVFGEYKITSIYAVIGTFALPIASLLAGVIAFANQTERKQRVINWILNAGVVLQFVMSMLQFARILGFSNPIIALITEWDITAQARLKEEYVILGRSIGTYISPNILGVWAMAAFFWNIINGRGITRVLFAGLSLITLFLSQARGSGFAFVAALFFYLVIASQSARWMSGGIKAIALTSSLTVIGTILLAMFIPDFSLIPGLERWREGFSVIAQGSQADANFAGRIEVWREALYFMREYPLGTLGPPQVIFILPPDNQYVHLLLQGSVYYVMTFLIGLMGSIALIFRRSKEAVLVATFAVAIAVNSVSALPLFYSPGLLFWFFLGCYLSEEVHSRAKLSASNTAFTNSVAPDRGVMPVFEVEPKKDNQSG